MLQCKMSQSMKRCVISQTFSLRFRTSSFDSSEPHSASLCITKQSAWIPFTAPHSFMLNKQCKVLWVQTRNHHLWSCELRPLEIVQIFQWQKITHALIVDLFQLPTTSKNGKDLSWEMQRNGKVDLFPANTFKSTEKGGHAGRSAAVHNRSLQIHHFLKPLFLFSCVQNSHRSDTSSHTSLPSLPWYRIKIVVRNQYLRSFS